MAISIASLGIDLFLFSGNWNWQKRVHLERVMIFSMRILLSIGNIRLLRLRHLR